MTYKYIITETRIDPDIPFYFWNDITRKLADKNGRISIQGEESDFTRTTTSEWESKEAWTNWVNMVEVKNAYDLMHEHNKEWGIKFDKKEI